MYQIDEEFIIKNFETAIENNYVKPFFQPIIRSLTGEICAAETLARWEDPDKGLLAPYMFIDVLEKKHLIHKLDLKMLEDVCRGYARFREKGISPLPFSVNLSRLDFEENDIFERITGILKKYNVPASAVHLEITESVMLDKVESFRIVFNCFKAAGFEMWLDDFGSGYTSLNVLKDYDFDVLKVDMKFLSSADARAKMLVASVINMAKTLGVHTLAEGVETAEQFDFLKSIGCEMVQGYYYSKPLDKRGFMEYIDKSGISVENPRERDYYKSASMLNTLSPDPLGDYKNNTSNYLFEAGQTSVALMEMSGNKFNFIYASSEYLKESEKLGLSDLKEISELVNDRTKPFYYDTQRQVQTTAQTNEVVRKDYMFGDICYSFSTKFLAKTADKIMVAMSIKVFGDNGIESRFEEINKYGRSLFYNFERVTMIYPESDSSKLIYANTAFSKVYGTVSLRRGTIEFAMNEVYAEDKERYLDFMDLRTLYDRIVKDNCSFVQQPFRLKTPEGGYRWRLVRITRIPTADNSPCYMYSIQRMPPVDIAVIEEKIKEDPDMFKR